MESIHTNETYQEEHKEQLKDMTDEQIEQHIGGQYLKMLNENKIKHPQDQTLEYHKIKKDVDKFVLVIEGFI